MSSAFPYSSAMISVIIFVVLAIARTSSTFFPYSTRPLSASIRHTDSAYNSLSFKVKKTSPADALTVSGTANAKTRNAIMMLTFFLNASNLIQAPADLT